MDAHHEHRVLTPNGKERATAGTKEALRDKHRAIQVSARHTSMERRKNNAVKTHNVNCRGYGDH